MMFTGNDVYRTAVDCHECTTSVSTLKRKGHLKQFRANEHLKFINMDILAPLPKTTNGNQFIFVITDRYTMLTWAIHSSKVTALHVMSMIFDH